jgi:GNAT superfamily N-acetyltransferase
MENVESRIFTTEMNLSKISVELAEMESLNFGIDGFDAGFIASHLMNVAGAAVILFNEGKAVGYTAANSARSLYVSNVYYLGRDFNKTAYLVNSSLRPEFQRKGLIWQMMEPLEEELRKKGYQFLDRDSKADTGYADKVIRHYGDRVVFARLVEDTMWGKQQYIRVRL